MMYSIDALNKVLEDEKIETPDPSVTPDTNTLDLQAIVARLDRLEETVLTLRQTGTPNDSGADNNSTDSAANNDNKGDDNNES